ncbi:uncharacterized protein EAF01_008741 [Botrytis porri]|uniref:uncharacterized protein n=1 Tax=Botrytis porri TaxID=87229 RepID=UPI001902B5BD|nr:uncharacterized protein EAF01_008741 [Botrytis porri]KAF7897775.1 hypothetical protein EAF01_008741 [Botrytis porri]
MTRKIIKCSAILLSLAIAIIVVIPCVVFITMRATRTKIGENVRNALGEKHSIIAPSLLKALVGYPSFLKVEKCIGVANCYEIYSSLGSFNFKEDEWRDAPELVPTKCGNRQKIVSTATEIHSGWGDDLRCMNCIGT